jgi:tetratricopeptide (TPR) repeat protein
MNFNRRKRLAQEYEKAGEKYFDLKEYQAAADSSLKAVELLKGLKGAEQAYGIALGRAGMSFSCLKKYAQAIPLLEKALPILKQSQASPDDLATCYDYLAQSYNRKGNHAEAKKLHEKGLSIRKEYFGGKHPRVAESLNNLGNVYSAEKKYDLAQPFFEEALAILEQDHDTDSPSLSAPLNNLAVIYRSKGDHAKAKECSERALLLRNFDGFAFNYTVIQEEFRQLEEKAKESERLSYLGSMATGIAHNINNPTGIISLKAQRGLRRVKQDSLSSQEAEELFSGILHEAERLHNIIKRFQDFAKGDRTKRENVDLNALVQRVADYFSGQFQSHDVALNLELADSNPQAYANQFVVEEVLINLMTNAREEVEKNRGRRCG